MGSQGPPAWRVALTIAALLIGIMALTLGAVYLLRLGLQ